MLMERRNEWKMSWAEDVGGHKATGGVTSEKGNEPRVVDGCCRDKKKRLRGARDNEKKHQTVPAWVPDKDPHPWVRLGEGGRVEGRRRRSEE